MAGGTWGLWDRSREVHVAPHVETQAVRGGGFAAEHIKGFDDVDEPLLCVVEGA